MVKKLLFAVWATLWLAGCATPAPTSTPPPSTPTAAPTRVPTSVPTSAPTRVPTAAPTNTPLRKDLTELTVTEAAAAIRSQQITSVALTEALIKKIEAGKDLNAFIFFDKARALEVAKQADQAVSQGKALGPLHGVPLVVKDNIHVAGIPNTAGTPALKNFIPKENAPVIQALTDAGAIIIGKTNMHELAFGITSNNAAFGAVKNAYDPTRFAGGSSGGTAAAIAARMVPGGLGRDTGGSIRIPAALNGIAGFRPTFKRYSQDGITPLATTRDTAGPMARSVADLVLLDGVITGDQSKLEPTSLKGLRLGVYKAYFFQNIDAETLKLTENALDTLKQAGVEIVEVDIPVLSDLNEKVGFPVASYEANRDITAYLKKYQVGITIQELASKIASPDVKGVFDYAILGKQATSEAAYQDAINKYRPQLQQAYADAFKTYQIDALIFPTTPLPAQPVVGSDENVTLNGKPVPTFPTFIHNTEPGSNAGIPGLTMPIGRTTNGLPIGIGLDGPAGGDRRLLAIGLALETLFKPLPAPTIK